MGTPETAFKIGILAGAIFAGCSKEQVDVNVSWYYTWQPHTMQISRPRGVEFVPMIWNDTFVKPKELELAKESGSVLLGFNEPDGPDQANMTVEEALDLWPQLVAIGLRLGSPAPAGNPSLPGSWLERFIRCAATRPSCRFPGDSLVWRQLRCRGGGVNTLKDFLEAVYHKFQLPIWLTEYSLIR
jgi:Glycosyl hydrolase catalytic core